MVVSGPCHGLAQASAAVSDMCQLPLGGVKAARTGNPVPSSVGSALGPQPHLPLEWEHIDTVLIDKLGMLLLTKKKKK